MSYIRDLRKYVGHQPLIMVSAAAIMIKENRILLQKRTDLNCWAIHGGALELGEKIEDAMKREVKEEIGLTPTVFQFFKVFSGEEFKIKYPNEDIVYLVDNIFIVSKWTGEIKLDLNEVLEVKWFELDEIPWDSLISHNVLILKEYIARNR
ncbi:NUDIX domain-containing protein [Acholeplasma equirhinis]|uniref:NUDIX hydrolase n=1 Tax=Acholeplasma equirhinis TaxID=555393 RepID=UPI00197AE2BB|nr:NUDIX domain-containing protein [Acholeplasma equirhinis]MBN3490683.1 NUDIX domain-containing protein [Acholeplasma equirhinis]